MSRSYGSRNRPADVSFPASNIDTAIRACKEEKGDLIQSQKQMQVVKETLNDGYCDISGNVGDLSLLGKLGVLYQSFRPEIIVTKARWGKSGYILPRVWSFTYTRDSQPDEIERRRP